MAKNVGDIITKPEKYFKAVYNSSSEYTEDVSLDFYDQIYPRMLKFFLDDLVSTGVAISTIYTNFNGATKVEGNLETSILGLGNIIFYMFEPAIQKHLPTPLIEERFLDLSVLEKKRGIVGALARLRNNIKSEDAFSYLQGLVTFFMDQTSLEFKLRKTIPQKFANIMTKFLQNSFCGSGKFLGDADFITYAREYKFVTPKDAVKELLPLPSNIKILPTNRNKLFLVIQNLKLDDSDEQFFEESIGGRTTQLLCDGIIYDHCYFDSFLQFLGGILGVRVVFKNCTFNNHIAINRAQFERVVKFENCKFLKGIQVTNCTFETALYFQDCIFYNNGSVKIENCTFKKFNPGHFNIQNCTFYCPFSLKGSKCEGELRIENTAFFYTFDFTNLTFNSNTATISNIAFNNGKDIEKSKEILAETLDKNKLHKAIKNLGISEKETNKTKFDYDDYQIALRSGYLNTEYAARYLGVKEITLKKKRTADSKMLTRESIPYIKNGRKVLYSVEALDAYKEKNWKKLGKTRFPEQYIPKKD